MQLSYLLIVIWLLIACYGLVISTHRLYRVGLASFIAAVSVLVYVYLEMVFKNLQSFNGMSAYFYYSLSSFYAKRGIGEEAAKIIGQGIWLLILYLAIFILWDVLLSFFSLGGAPKEGKQFTKRIIPYILFVSSFGFLSLVLLSMFSPFLHMPFGFMDGLFNIFFKRFSQ